MRLSVLASSVIAIAALVFPSDLRAQTPSTDSPWSAEASLGWDLAVSGDVLSAGLGRAFDQPIAVNSQSYRDIYGGTGITLALGAGYTLDDRGEARASIRWESAGTDLHEIGTVLGSSIWATFDSYRAVTIEGGYRRYFADRTERMRPFAGATLGVAIIGDINAKVIAPTLNTTLSGVRVYDRSSVLAFGLNAGVLYAITDRIDAKGEVGLRHTGAPSAPGTSAAGLEQSTGDPGGRWTLPISFGARIRF